MRFVRPSWLQFLKHLPLFSAVLVLILAGVSASAQSAPNLENGYKAYGSYQGSNLDTVNTMNGNLMLHVPMPWTWPQRGANITPHNLLTVSSKGWSVQCVSVSGSSTPNCYWTLGQGAGALIAVQGTGLGFDHTMDLALHRTYETDSDSTGGSLAYSTYGYSLSTADGSSHALTASPNSAVDANGYPLSMDSIDTTGYHVDLSGLDSTNSVPSVSVVTDRRGNRYLLGRYSGPCHTSHNNNLNGNTITTICNQAAGITTITDVNGNVYTVQSSSGALDTLGRNFLSSSSSTSTSDYSNCVGGGLSISSAALLNYPGPGGVTNQVKACYATLTASTAFGVSGVAEVQNAPGGAPTVQVLVTLIMPDGTKWTFSYDSYVNVTQVGLPLGGSISYTWTTVSTSTNCGANLSRAVASRTINDNNGHSYLWNYTWGTAGNTTLTNTVTDALGNDTVHVFSALDVGSAGFGCTFYETSTQSYQGTGGTRQLLKQIDTTYSSAMLGDQTGGGSGLGNVVPTSIQTTLYPAGKVSLVTRIYDPGLGTGFPIFANVVVEKEYDWGQGSHGPLLRETDTTYQWQVNSAYLSARLVDLPASMVIKDSSGNRVAETDYTYDESQYLTSSNITTQHVAAPNAPPVRGNLTTTSKWLNTINTFIASHTNWYDTGEVYQQIDPLTHATTHSYDSYYAGGYSTKTCNALSQCVSGAYDFNTGLLTSFTDANASYQASGNTQGDPAHTSNYSYDFMSRMTAAMAAPDSSGNRPQATFNYPNSTTVERLKKITTTVSDDSFSYLDGLGRAIRAQHNTPSGNALVDTTFDALDHVILVTNPYFSTTEATYGVIQTQFDALGRVIQTTKQDGSVSTVSYNGNCATAIDEAGKRRKSCADGLGRRANVWEDPLGLNYETDYQYDPLGNLLRVDQKGSAPADSTQWRTRLFTYDSFSRLLTANNPESGTITYSYDSDNNLLTRTDARSVTTTYAYDPLHRVTTRTYSDTTPATSFVYDQANPWGWSTLGNPIGRLVAVNTGSSNGVSRVFSYDPLGRVTTEWQCLPTCPAILAQYDLASDLTQLTYPSGRTIKLNYNAATQLDGVTYDNWNGNSVGYSYWSVNDSNFYANGTPKVVALGNGANETTTLNKRMQLQEETVTNSSIGTFADHTYSYGTQNNGNIMSAIDQLNSSRTQTFTYDPLDRLATASESRWGLGFVYDSWGNRLQQNVTSGSAGQMVYTVDGKNRIAGAGSNCTNQTAYCYDPSGNLLNDGFHKYVFDGESRISNVDSGNATYTYDADGNRVQKSISGGPSTIYFYFGGQAVAELDVTNNYWTDYISAGGKRIAKADTFINMARTQGTCSTPSSGCKSTFWFRNSGLIGYRIQSGDKLYIVQNINTGAVAGPGLTYRDANGNVTQGDAITNVFDQNGCPMNQDCSSWANYYRFRRMDLTPLAGMTIADDPLVETNWTSTSTGTWYAYWGDYVLVSADGTVRPIFAGTAWGQSITLASSNQAGTSNVLGFLDKELCWTCASLTTNFYHDDQIGSSRLLTAGGGWPTWQGTFLPYGEEYNNPQITPNHYKFTGKERDNETGLDYFGARYYANALGRFSSPDPKELSKKHIMLPQRWNKYSYVQNNPIGSIDPDGFEDYKIFLASPSAGGDWDKAAAVAKANGHTLEVYRGKDATIGNFNAALMDHNNRVVFVGDTTHADGTTTANALKLNDGRSVGTLSVATVPGVSDEAGNSVETLMPATFVFADTVAAFGCNSIDLAEGFTGSGANFIGMDSGTDGASTFKAMNAAATAFVEADATARPANGAAPANAVDPVAAANKAFDKNRGTGKDDQGKLRTDSDGDKVVRAQK